MVKLLSLVSSCRLHQLLLVQLHSVDSMNCNDVVTQSASTAKTIQSKEMYTHVDKQQQPTIKTSSLSSLHTLHYTKLTISINIIILLYYAMVGEIITSIAHICAILLGLLLWKIASGRDG